MSSPSGTDSIELLEQPLTVISTNASERQLAITKYNASQAASSSRSSSKSKSPHRTAPPSPVPSVPPLESMPVPHSAPSGGDRRAREGDEGEKQREGKRQRESRAPKRPHTSAGPRDRAKGGGGGMLGAGGVGVWRPGTAAAGGLASKEGLGGGLGIGAVVGIGGVHTVRINTVTGVTTTHAQASGGAASPDHVRAWEEELARIEAQSRRSSIGILSRPKIPSLAKSARRFYGEVLGR